MHNLVSLKREITTGPESGAVITYNSKDEVRLCFNSEPHHFFNEHKFKGPEFKRIVEEFLEIYEEGKKKWSIKH